MTDLRTAAQQALEALEHGQHTLKQVSENQWESRGELARQALRAALAEPPTDWEAVAADQAMTIALMKAEPTQEPVAWMVYTLDGKSVCVTDNPADFTDEHRVLPLYTSPPQRKPLTEEELDALAIDEDGLPNSHIEFARAIERAHGIGGSDE